MSASSSTIDRTTSAHDGTSSAHDGTSSAHDGAAEPGTGTGRDASTPARSGSSTLLRGLAVVSVLAGGGVHLQQWLAGFRDIPVIGPLFLADAIAAVVVVAFVVIRRDRLGDLAAVVFSAGALLGLGLSYTVGLFGFMEGGVSLAIGLTVLTETLPIVLLVPGLVHPRTR